MDPLIASLLRSTAYPHPTGPLSLVETHISWVVLTGTYAYKVKKPVNLGFVDFSTLERRRHFCQEELRLNSRLAPELYGALVEIHGPAEQASLKGSGPVIEVAVRMRQFDQRGLLPLALASGAVTDAHWEAFAERLATFHGKAAIAPAEGPYGTPAVVVAPAMANLEVLERLQPQLLSPQLRAWTEHEAQRLRSVFQARLAGGHVREGHGDLHLGNLVLHQGQVLGFDCLEFNAELRWIDVLSDVAFLAMDLRQCGAPELAGRLLNRWLSVTGDYGGLATWRWYVTYRALVRAKVLALRLQQLGGGDERERRDLTLQMERYGQQALHAGGPPRTGALLLTHGVSGSGKSHIATALCHQFGWLHLRSDVERRRMFGRWGQASGPVRTGDAYAESVTEGLYGEWLPRAAEAALGAGWTVIVDATFLRRAQRQTFQALAEKLGADWLILSCSAPLELARRRIAERESIGSDPSEADERVLLRQWGQQEALSEQEQAHTVEVTGLEPTESALRNRLGFLSEPACAPGPIGRFRTTRSQRPRRC